MDNREMNEHESLELITRMIRQTQQRIVRDAGRPFLIWGYTTLAVSIFEFIIIATNANMAWRWGWWSIPVIGWVLMYLFGRKEPQQAKSYIDHVISSVWIVFGVSTLFAFATAVLYHTSIFHLMTLFMGMGTAITGLITRSRWVTVGGFTAMAASLLFVWFKGNPQYYAYSPLLFAAIFTLMMIIPGHIINRQSRRQCSKS